MRYHTPNFLSHTSFYNLYKCHLMFYFLNASFRGSPLAIMTYNLWNWVNMFFDVFLIHFGTFVWLPCFPLGRHAVGRNSLFFKSCLLKNCFLTLAFSPLWSKQKAVLRRRRRLSSLWYRNLGNISCHHIAVVSLPFSNIREKYFVSPHQNIFSNVQADTFHDTESKIFGLLSLIKSFQLLFHRLLLFSVYVWNF